MTVQSLTRFQNFTGGQGVLNFNFRTIYNEPSYIQVNAVSLSSGTITPLVYNVGYTVVLNSSGIGGTVTVLPTYSTAYNYVVYRLTPLTQTSDYNDYNAFPAATIENNLDQLTLIEQENSDDYQRSLQVPIGTTPTISTTLPIPVPNTVLGWNGTGTVLTNYDPATVSFVVVSTASTLGLSDGVIPSQHAVKTYIDLENGVWVGPPSGSDDTTNLQNIINTVPTNGVICFQAGATYKISSTLTFAQPMGIRFNGCIFNYNANGTAIQIGPTSGTTINEGWMDGHVQVIRTATISHNGSQTATSQLLGSGIFFTNVFGYLWKGSSYVQGFEYGYYFGNAATCIELHNLQSNDCLVDFYFNPSSVANAYTTAIDIYSMNSIFNPAFYSSITGAWFIYGTPNNKTLDGINFWGGNFGGSKPYLYWNASWSSFNNMYWNQSSSATDIQLDTLSQYNIIFGGAGLTLCNITDSGTSNSIYDTRVTKFTAYRESGTVGTTLVLPYASGSITLATSSTTTLLAAFAITTNSSIVLTPLTSHSASLVGSVYVVYSALSQAYIHHPSSTNTDNTFSYVIINSA